MRHKPPSVSQHGASPGPLPRARLRPARPPGADAIVWSTRAAIAVLLLSILWLAVVALKPLPQPSPHAPGARPEVPVVEWTPTPIEVRQAFMDAQRGINLFDDDRKPWSEGASLAGAINAENEPDPEPVRSTPALVDGSPALASNAGVYEPDPDELVPDDVRKALKDLVLRGIRSRRSGEMIALISLVHSSQPLASTEYIAGDEFTDPKNNKAPWYVLAVDDELDRVILERSGSRVALDLYPETAGLAASSRRAGAGSGPSAAPDARAGGVIEHRSRSEIVAELLKADRPVAEIQALLALLDENEAVPDDPRAETPSAPNQTAAGAPATATPSAGTKPPAPPPGLETLLRIMASGRMPDAQLGENPSVEPTDASKQEADPK